MWREVMQWWKVETVDTGLRDVFNKEHSNSKERTGEQNL